MDNIQKAVESCLYLSNLITNTLNQLKDFEINNNTNSEEYLMQKSKLKNLLIEETKLYEVFNGKDFDAHIGFLYMLNSKSKLLENIPPQIINENNMRRFKRNIGKIIVKERKKQLIILGLDSKLFIKDGGPSELFIIEELNREFLNQLEYMINDDKFKNIREKLINSKYEFLNVIGNNEHNSLLLSKEIENINSFAREHNNDIKEIKSKFLERNFNILSEQFISQKEENFNCNDNAINIIVNYLQLKSIIFLMSPDERNLTYLFFKNFSFSKNSIGKKLVIQAFKEIDKDFFDETLSTRIKI